METNETKARKDFEEAFGKKSPQMMDLETSSNRNFGIRILIISPSIVDGSM